MCLMVYLASATPLPLVPFDPQNPVFVVRELTPADKVYPAVKNITHQPHLYQAGSYQGCGCGFMYDPADDPALIDELPERLHSLAALKQYLTEQKTKQLLLYICWAGEEGLQIETQQTLTPNHIGTTSAVDDTRQLIYIK